MKQMSTVTRWILLVDAAITLFGYWAVRHMAFEVSHPEHPGLLDDSWDLLAWSGVWCLVIVANLLAARPVNGDAPWVRTVLLGVAVLALVPIVYVLRVATTT